METGRTSFASLRINSRAALVMAQEPENKSPSVGALFSGSPGRTRTADKVVNSHLLYQLSYRGSVGIKAVSL